MPYCEHMTTSPDLGSIPEWTITDRLRKSREHANMDQTQLAERIGMARTTVSNYENGVTPPKRPILLSWALATGVPLEWLQTGRLVTDSGGGASVSYPDWLRGAA